MPPHLSRWVLQCWHGGRCQPSGDSQKFQKDRDQKTESQALREDKDRYRQSCGAYSPLRLCLHWHADINITNTECVSESPHPCLSVLPGAPGGTVVSSWASWRVIFSPEVDVYRGRRCSVWEAVTTRFHCQEGAWQWGSWCFPWKQNWQPGEERIQLIPPFLHPASPPSSCNFCVRKALLAPDSGCFTCDFSSGSCSTRKGYWKDFIMSTDTEFLLSR